LGGRSPFVAPLDKRDEADAAKRMFSEDQSDHLTNLNAFNGEFIFILVCATRMTPCFVYSVDRRQVPRPRSRDGVHQG
jgi:hypothetical protein